MEQNAPNILHSVHDIREHRLEELAQMQEIAREWKEAQHFFSWFGILGEWSSFTQHARIRQILQIQALINLSPGLRKRVILGNHLFLASNMPNPAHSTAQETLKGLVSQCAALRASLFQWTVKYIPSGNNSYSLTPGLRPNRQQKLTDSRMPVSSILSRRWFFMKL